MHSIAIRQIEDELKERLRVEAAQQGCSMEELARRLLRTGLAASAREASPVGAATHRHLVHRIRARFQAEGGVDLSLPQRTLPRQPPRF